MLRTTELPPEDYGIEDLFYEGEQRVDKKAALVAARIVWQEHQEFFVRKGKTFRDVEIRVGTLNPSGRDCQPELTVDQSALKEVNVRHVFPRGQHREAQWTTKHHKWDRNGVWHNEAATAKAAEATTGFRRYAAAARPRPSAA